MSPYQEPNGAVQYSVVCFQYRRRTGGGVNPQTFAVCNLRYDSVPRITLLTKGGVICQQKRRPQATLSENGRENDNMPPAGRNAPANGLIPAAPITLNPQHIATLHKKTRGAQGTSDFC